MPYQNAFGLQHFKIASYAVRPFGRHLITQFDRYPIMNILWIAGFGWLLPIVHLVVGTALCITVIGIPFGKKCYRLASITFVPFGAIH